MAVLMKGKKVSAVSKEKEVAGFRVLKDIEIPKKLLGGRSSIYRELFNGLETGECAEIPFDGKPTAKMNALYNAARKNNVKIVIRVHERNDNGGTLRVWKTE